MRAVQEYSLSRGLSIGTINALFADPVQLAPIEST